MRCTKTDSILQHHDPRCIARRLSNESTLCVPPLVRQLAATIQHHCCISTLKRATHAQNSDFENEDLKRSWQTRESSIIVFVTRPSLPWLRPGVTPQSVTASERSTASNHQDILRKVSLLPYLFLVTSISCWTQGIHKKSHESVQLPDW